MCIGATCEKNMYYELQWMTWRHSMVAAMTEGRTSHCTTAVTKMAVTMSFAHKISTCFCRFIEKIQDIKLCTV